LVLVEMVATIKLATQQPLTEIILYFQQSHHQVVVEVVLALAEALCALALLVVLVVEQMLALMVLLASQVEQVIKAVTHQQKVRLAVKQAEAVFIVAVAVEVLLKQVKQAVNQAPI
jgi:hypothetical protein